ncbi:ABC-three component system protein [Sorangium sp. So ce375]|uniref:ABC-three component system protein n=1 Tax=Sorangium sp. So ce375 TaxID=3133306 RepID=UPI003F5C037C
MVGDSQSETHSAEAAALGFYYQSFFALLTLLERSTDDAAIAIEQLDDVELKADGQTLLFQLKHSIRPTPPPITLKSRALWRTMKVWIDALPGLTLSETTFHLVAVAGIPRGSPFTALTSLAADRDELVKAMVNEAQRVRVARAAASNKNKELPHADRVDGCEAFLSLSETERLNLLRRTVIRQDSPVIGKIEEHIAEHLKIVHPDQRPTVATRLVEWWDRQIVYSLCGKRERVLLRAELQDQISLIIGDLEQGKLLADFETVSEPEDYQPDGMLARQIRLVEGKKSDLSKAIREEWRAREQRSKWMNEKPSMATVIGEYDRVLQEHWSDRHCQMVEDCAGVDDKEKRASGLRILRWTHENAPNIVRPISAGWNAPYYVRGSYQVLAINRKVGWHPDYATLLGGDE